MTKAFESIILPEELQQIKNSELKNYNNQIILYNDDVNTFDWVIDCLIEVCQHDWLQAEQCAHIVHHNGRCSVKEGHIDKLEPMATALAERGLSVNVE